MMKAEKGIREKLSMMRTKLFIALYMRYSSRRVPKVHMIEMGRAHVRWKRTGSYSDDGGHSWEDSPGSSRIRMYQREKKLQKDTFRWNSLNLCSTLEFYVTLHFCGSFPAETIQSKYVEALYLLCPLSLFVVVLQEERDRFRNKHTFEEYREVEGRRKTLFSPSDFWGHVYFTKRETVEDWFLFAKTKWYKKIFTGVEWYNLLSICYLCIRILHSGEIENVIHRIKYLNISNFRDVLTRRIVFYK